MYKLIVLFKQIQMKQRTWPTQELILKYKWREPYNK